MSDKRLRLITYLSPGIPLQVFETIMQYLEEVTGREAYLISESRWSGPPRERTDPFAAGDVDIGFMSNAYLLSMQEKKSVELCKAAPVHIHSKSENNPVCFSDLIIYTDDLAKYKDFRNLRGHSFAYDDENSLDGCLLMLQELKKLGYNSNFFGNVHRSGSHLKSIEMVLNKTAESAAVNSTVLHSYRTQNPQNKDKITVIKSFGPIPTYPIVFSSHLSDDLKEEITQGLLNMSSKKEWMGKLEPFGVTDFKPVDMTPYLKEQELITSVQKLSITAAYY